MPKPSAVQGIHEPARVQLFMLRMWREELGEGCVQWCGKVQHVTGGEARYFRDWPALSVCLQEMLSATPDEI